MVESARERDVSSFLEDGNEPRQEARDAIYQFGDLGIEANRIAYVEVMILDRVLPRCDGEANRLERAFSKLPRRTMNEVVATAAKLNKARSQRSALLLEGFERYYVSQGDLEARDAAAQ